MQPITSAPYTLLVGDTTIHLLSKFSADASAVVGARVKDGEPELYAMSLVAAQREKEQQQLAQQAAAASAPVIQGADSLSPSQPATPTKIQKSVTPSTLGPVVRDLWGVFGIIGLHQGPFIIAITAVAKLGRWLGAHDIYQVTKVSLIPISSIPLFVLNDEEKKREATLIEKLTTFLEESGFLFSYTFDLTNTAQRQAAFPKNVTPPPPLYVNADLRFYWNHFLQEEFPRLHLEPWILPCVQGFVALIDGVGLSDNVAPPASPSAQGSDSLPSAPSAPVQPPNVDEKKKFQYALISRRSCVRTGPRLHMRGADYEGHAATFSEQEQLVCCNGSLSSFVQTRGSIPLLWHQLDRKQMKPKPVVIHTAAQRRTARRHFAAQRQMYGAVVVISLLDQTGIELDLAEAYETYTRLIADAKLSFVAFDFHEICKGGKYENISVLLQQVKSDLAEHGFFQQGPDGRGVTSQQSGVMRVNCLDCLDRTNVVQSVFAHHILRNQMEALGVLSGGEPVERMAEFEAAWKNAWADNADAMSRLYTGTGALKTAFTRTGQWTVSGALMDGMTSAKRYVNQTVYDDEKLKLQHLLLGEHLIFRGTAMLEECESDGIFRFKVMKQQLAAPPDPVVLEVDIMKGQFTHFALKDNTKRVRSLSRLYRVVRAQRNVRRLRVIFSQNPAPKDYDFRDPESREKCVQALRSAVAVAAQKAGPDASTELMPLLPLSKYERPLKLFLGCWNLANETSPSFESWLPRDQEMYAIAVQNCDYPKRADFYFSSTAHFCFALHEYLGARFERVATAQYGSLLTVIYVHSDLAPFVSSTEIVSLRYPAEAPPKPQPTGNSSPGFFGRLLGRSPSPDPRARSGTPTPADEGDSKGHAVCMHVHDTGLAFLHQYVSIEAIPRSDVMDMYSSYDHIFSLGRLNAPSARWAELARHPKSDENTTISWRSSAAPRLFAVQPTSPIVPITSSVSAAALLPSPAPPTTLSPNTAKLSPSPSSDESVLSLTVPPSTPPPAASSTPGPATPAPTPAPPTPSGTAASLPSPSAASDSPAPLSAPTSAGPDAAPRKGSRAVAFLNELAAVPSVLPPAANTTSSDSPAAPAASPPTASAPVIVPPANPSAPASYSLLEQSSGSPIRRKSSRAGEFLLQMNRAEASSITTKDDSSPASRLPATASPSPVAERKNSLHRRAVSDGSKIFGRQQRIAPLGMTCSLSVVCDFYRPSPSCSIILAGPRSANLKLASSVTPLKGEIFLVIEAPFINSIRTKLSPKSTNNSWAWDDIEINPFISDPEYLRLRHLLITAYDVDMLGNPVLIGIGRLPLAPVLAGPSDQRCALFSDDTQSGIITFAALARVASIGRKPSMGKIIQQSP